MKKLLILAAVALLFVWAIWGLYHAGPQAVVGRPAPDFTLPSAAGGKVHLAAYRGKVVLLNFWTSWCQPCQKEIPDLVAFARASGAKLQVIGADRMESIETVRLFARAHGMEYPIALDKNGALSSQFGVTGQPESFWIDPHGVLREHIVGPMTPGRMRAAFAALATGG